MRILSIRLKNINSIYGDWTIDLRHPDYRHYGIFAITGPTGSGKTTLLDAVCLALYGRTPRMDVSGSENEVMSRQTAESEVEVGFSVNGKTYRAWWHQHRARKSPDGALQKIERELSLCRDNDPFSKAGIIEDKPSVVLRKIVEITGMEFSQFLRSILLAQGGFAAFLQSERKERSAILEQLSGTSVYSEISQWVHVKESEESKLLKALEIEAGGVRLMTADERNALNREIAECDQEVKKAGDTLAGEEAALRWLEGIEKLEAELVSLEAVRLRLHAEETEINPLKDRCVRAERAVPGEIPYALSLQIQAQLEEAIAAKAVLDQKLPIAHEAVQACLGKVNDAMLRHSKSLESRKTLTEVLIDVRRLDVRIADARERVGEAQRESREAHEALAKLEAGLQAKEAQVATLQKQLHGIREYLDANAGDAGLLENFSGIEELSRQLDVLNSDAEREMSTVGKAEGAERIAASDVDALQKKREAAAKLLDDVRARRGQLEAAMRQLPGSSDLDALEAVRDELAMNVQGNLGESIVVLRRQLVEGEACPVCGSVHRVSAGDLPSLNGFEARQAGLAVRMEELKQQILAVRKARSQTEVLEKEETRANDLFRSADAALNQARETVASLAKLRLEAKERLNAVNARVEAVDRRLQSLLESCKVDAPFGLDASMLKDLEARKNRWIQYQGRIRDLDASFVLGSGEIQSLRQSLEDARVLAGDKSAKLSGRTSELELLVAQRREKFGDRDPAVEESRADAELSALQLAVEDGKRLHEAAVRELGLLTQCQADLDQKIRKLEVDHAEQKREWLSRIEAAGFGSASDWMEARLDPEIRNEMVAKIAGYDRRLNEHKSATERTVKLLDEEKSKGLTGSSKDQVWAAIDHAKKIQREWLEALGAKREQARADDLARQRHGLLQGRMEIQRAEWLRWKELDDLIGSADGNKFRNIAQIITFEFLVRRADQELRNLSERYRLRRNPRSEMDLEVLDTWQADEVRPIGNLSGGETFLVSLALALGMSAISSGQSSMDSLFLDEGFGTLDEDALQQVMSALASLHQSSKLIGVISHVEALKESLPVRISVLPTGGGRSVLDGPGVSMTAQRELD